MTSSSSSPMDAQRYDLSKRPASRRLLATHSSLTSESEDAQGASVKTEHCSFAEPPIGQKTSNYLQTALPILAKYPSKTLRDALHSGRRVFSAQSPASENQSGDGESSHTTIRVIQPGKSFNIFSSCMSMPSATLDSIHYICGDEFDQERVIYEWCEKETKGQNPASIEIRYQADTRCHFAPEIRRRRPIRPTAFIA